MCRWAIARATKGLLRADGGSERGFAMLMQLLPALYGSGDAQAPPLMLGWTPARIGWAPAGLHYHLMCLALCSALNDA